MYESGSIIAEEGQPIHGLIVIVEGAVSVWKRKLQYYCNLHLTVLEDVRSRQN